MPSLIVLHYYAILSFPYLTQSQGSAPKLLQLFDHSMGLRTLNLPHLVGKVSLTKAAPACAT